MKNQKTYRLLDDELVDEIAALPLNEQKAWLFLVPHSKFAGRWYVDSLHQGFFLDFEDLIGKYRTVSPAGLETFLQAARELEYHVAFTKDPVEILDAYEHLNDPPPFSLNSDMEGTINGFLPFQLQGYNYLRNADLKSGLALWSTGTGKTALMTGLIKYHLEVERNWDLVLCVVKSNNKVDTQRKLKSLGDIESFIIEANAKRRKGVYIPAPVVRVELYDLFNEIMDEGTPLVGITNYEKFREEQDQFVKLVEGRRVVIFWDEMPMKLSNRKTVLYESVRDTLYDGGARIFWDNLRPAALRQYDMTATAIENSPVGLLNQVRILDPDIFPAIKEWERRYVATRNFFNKEPETFHHLDELGLRLDFMTHQVDKDDPDIAVMFPEVHEITRYVDWAPAHRKHYEKLQDIAGELAMAAKTDPKVKAFNAFQLIGVLQMLCDAPSMVQKSADNREEFEAALAAAITEDEVEAAENSLSGSEAAMILIRALKNPLTDEGHTKIEALREIIMEKHPDEKIVVFSKLADYIQPVLVHYFDKWGVTYVVYRGTDKQRLEAKDRFRNDPSIRIFLSSDAGSDSIDLPEASVAVDYDEPMKWSTKIQRRNRIHRVNSTFKFVTFYTLRMVNSIEDRIAEIIEKKMGFHRGVFKGEISETAISARMTSEDLLYILLGHTED